VSVPLGEKAREFLRVAKGMGFLPGFLAGLLLGRLAGGDTFVFGLLLGLAAGLLLARWSEEGA
jgi:fructose-specific phosphotransferase system IIC component